jgi:hypothetical protein
MVWTGVDPVIVIFCWIVLGLIHLAPALALFRPALIGTLYGVDVSSPTFLLLHHRAALFLLVVIICAWAALRPEVRLLATVSVAVSMTSFLWLYAAAGQPPALRTIAIADLAGLPFLAIAAWSAFMAART